MTGGGKFYFRPKEGLFAADDLSTLYVYLPNKICDLSLQAFKCIDHYFLCSISESDLVNNEKGKKLFGLLCHQAICLHSLWACRAFVRMSGVNRINKQTNNRKVY